MHQLIRRTMTTLTRSRLYANKTFQSTSNTANGEVSTSTTFHYQQEGSVVWASYSGGTIVRGSIIGRIVDDETGELDMRYHHINDKGELMTGMCRSTPEVLSDGRVRLYEKWKWTCGDGSLGESVVEEVR